MKLGFLPVPRPRHSLPTLTVSRPPEECQRFFALFIFVCLTGIEHV